MTVISQTIKIDQIEKETRWDVPFNIELKNLYDQNTRVICIDDIQEHITNGATPLGAQFLDDGVNFYRANDVKRYSLDYFNHKYISKDQSRELKRSILKSGDIIFTIKGKVGDVAVFPKDQDESNINQDNALIRLKDGYDPYYFCGVFNSKFGLNQVKAFATETVNPFLGLGNLRKLRLPILSERDQKFISQRVKEAEELELKSLEIIKKAQNLFYKKIGINFTENKKKLNFSVNTSEFINQDFWTPLYSFPLYVNALKMIKKKFNCISLGEITNIIRGDEVGSENYNKYLDKKDNDKPFIRTSDLLNYEIDQFPDYYIPNEIYDELNQDITTGDVLFTKDGKIGMSAVITKNDKCIISSGIARLRLNAKSKKYNITPEYLFILLSLNETGIFPAKRRTVIASTIPHLREERLKEFEIPILEESTIEKITELVKKSFEFKDQKKNIIKNLRIKVDNFFDI